MDELSPIEDIIWPPKKDLRDPNEAVLTFFIQGDLIPIIEIRANGDFYYKGRFVEKDLGVYLAFKEWLGRSGMYGK